MMVDITSRDAACLVDELVGAFQYAYLNPTVMPNVNRDRNANMPVIRVGSPIDMHSNPFDLYVQAPPDTAETSATTTTGLDPDAVSSEQDSATDAAPVIVRDTGVPYRVSTPVGWLLRPSPFRGLSGSKSISTRAAARYGPKKPFLVTIPAESVGVPLLEVERTGLSTAPPTWTALPQWTLNQANVYADARLARAAESLQFNSYVPHASPSPIFTKTGLRFFPSDGDSNIYRTVVVEGLPPWVSMHEVLSRVEGGKIEFATMLDTQPIVRGYVTIMIRFVLQSGAQEFLRRTHGAIFLGYWPAQVRQVGTPTYPLSEQMDKEINQWGRTRCLKVHSEYVDLRGYLRCIFSEAEWSVWIEFTQENVLAGTTIFHFTSIKMAVVAYDILRSTGNFRDADLEFTHDPCAV